jgi:hypothetical protein
VREGGVTVVVDGATVLDCEAEPPRGAAGIGLIGAGPLHVDSLDVQR